MPRAVRDVKETLPFNTALAVLSGLLTSIAFPPYHLSAFAWVAFIPIFIASYNFVPPLRFVLGVITGFSANLLILNWLWKTFAAAHVSMMTTLACWVLLSLLMGLYFGVFFFGYSYLPHHWSKPWFAAAFWVILEHARSVLVTGFPWTLLAYSQSQNTYLIQTASVVGAWGISFLIILFVSSLSEYLFHMDKKRRTHFIFVSVFILLLHALGARRLNSSFTEEGVPFKVSILQGNINQYQKWNDDYVTAIEQQYERLALVAAQNKPDLIIWPESAAPGWIPNEPLIASWAKAVVLKTKVPNLIGAVTRIEGKDYNAALLYDAQGNMINVYAKQHLVPFGEYIPFGQIFARWIPYLGQLGTFHAGSGPVLFSVGAIRAVPNICYEALFAPLITTQVSIGANAIINITNDGWFLDTSAPAQHYIANIFRAVENGVPVIRAANTGISAVIDAYGREVVRSPLLTAGVYSATLSVKSPSVTVYSRVGRYLPQLCWIVVALGFLII